METRLMKRLKNCNIEPTNVYHNALKDQPKYKNLIMSLLDDKNRLNVVKVFFPREPYDVCLVETKMNGDCLFSSVGKALKTSVQSLRKIVAYSILLNENQSTVQFWRELYHSFMTENNETMLNEYKHIECVSNIPLDTDLTMRDKKLVIREMMKSSFWGEEYAIRQLESMLRIKIIVLNGDIKSFSKSLKHEYEYTPDKYVMVYLESKHYSLVSYNEQTVFTYDNLPIDIKEHI